MTEIMTIVAARADGPSAAQGIPDDIELVCSSGHRTTHSLARVLRLNDAWCGKCGADIRYNPLEQPEMSRGDLAPGVSRSALKGLGAGA